MGAEFSAFDLAPENEGGGGGGGGGGGEDFELVEGNTDAARATRASIVANLAREVRGEGMAAMEAAREAKARAEAREENAIKATRTALALEKMAITAKNVAASKAAAAAAGVPFRDSRAIRNSNSSSSSSSSSYKSYSSFFSEQSDVDKPDLVSYGELIEADGPEMLRDQQNRNMMREDIEREIEKMKSDTNAWIRFELSKGKEPTFASFKRKSSYTRDTRHRHRLNDGDWKKIFESSVDHILKETLFE